jgi:hypothetical protein
MSTYIKIAQLSVQIKPSSMGRLSKIFSYENLHLCLDFYKVSALIDWQSFDYSDFLASCSMIMNSNMGKLCESQRQSSHNKNVIDIPNALINKRKNKRLLRNQ